MTIRRQSSWRATDGVRWKRFSSTSRAAAASRARPRNDRTNAERPTLNRKRASAGRKFTAAHRRDDAAVLVPATLVVAAAARPCLLADGANGHVGLPAILHRDKYRFLRARWRHLYRCCAVVGYP